jgi:signal transduction histidine kinase
MGLFVLFTFSLWRPSRARWRAHGYLAAQSILILGMLARDPDIDSITGLFVALAFQAAVLFAGPTLWGWVTAMALLTAIPLSLSHGLLEGLALAMSPIAGIIAVPTLMVVHQQAEAAHAESQALLVELEGTRHELERSAEHVEELADLDERNRLARSLHDSVSQVIFTIALTARSVQLLLRDDPPRVRQQLEKLQELTATALGELRSLIAHMRP